jgi:hypothetical protein
MSRSKTYLAACAGLALAGGGALMVAQKSRAADHLDPPARTDPAMGGTDRNADIADVFAWHAGSGGDAKLITALSFSGPNPVAAGQKMPCDKDVLYTIHVQPGAAGEPADETKAHATINVRLGADDIGNCFATFDGLPNVTAPITVRTETPTRAKGFDLFVGLRDDAFFFDLDGFKETLMTGSIKMINDRDFFAKKNTPVIVVEMPLPSGAEIKVWGTTARAK